MDPNDPNDSDQSSINCQYENDDPKSNVKIDIRNVQSAGSNHSRKFKKLQL